MKYTPDEYQIIKDFSNSGLSFDDYKNNFQKLARKKHILRGNQLSYSKTNYGKSSTLGGNNPNIHNVTIGEQFFGMSAKAVNAISYTDNTAKLIYNNQDFNKLCQLVLEELIKDKAFIFDDPVDSQDFTFKVEEVNKKKAYINVSMSIKGDPPITQRKSSLKVITGSLHGYKIVPEFNLKCPVYKINDKQEGPYNSNPEIAAPIIPLLRELIQDAIRKIN